MSEFVSIADIKSKLQKNGEEWTKVANEIMEVSRTLSEKDNKEEE